MIGAGINADAMTDEEVVERVLAGETALFEIIMRRYNRRLYRVSRAILMDDREAEDVMQDAYVRAYTHLGQFEGRARFSTWLTKIAVHEAKARARRRSRFVDPGPARNTGEDGMNTFTSRTRDPEQQALSRELSVVLEAAVDALPEAYRSVFMLRKIEEMSTAETAECLDISEETVKVRLHRARSLLREEIYARIGTKTSGTFEFAGLRCDRLVLSVLDEIKKPRDRGAHNPA